MRIIVTIVVLLLVAFGAYAGYWFFAAERMRGAVAQWQEAQQAQGWTVGRERLEVTGFPGPHTIEITAFAIAAPEARGGWAAAAEALDVQAGGPFDFTTWTLRPQGALRITLPDGEEAVLAAENSHLRLDAGGGAVRHFYAEAQDLSIMAPTAAIQGAESMFIQGDRTEGAWRVLFETRQARITEGGFGAARTAFGGTVQTLALDLEAQEEGLAALAAGFAGLEQAGELSVHAAHLEWGAAVLSGQGALGVDGDGRLRGNFDVAVADVAEFLGALTGAGLLETRQANIAVAASTFFPRDDQDRIVLPFTFRDGDTRLGPVPVGQAPQIYRPDGAPPAP
jgi:hypothetical protein